MAESPKCQMDSSAQVEKAQAEVSGAPEAVLNCSSQPSSSHFCNETKPSVLQVLSFSLKLPRTLKFIMQSVQLISAGLCWDWIIASEGGRTTLPVNALCCTSGVKCKWGIELLVKIQDSHSAYGSTSFEILGQRALGLHSPLAFPVLLSIRGRFVSLALAHSSSSPREAGRGAWLRHRKGPTTQLHSFLLCSCFSLSLPLSFPAFPASSRLFCSFPVASSSRSPPQHTAPGHFHHCPSGPTAQKPLDHWSLKQRIHSLLL